MSSRAQDILADVLLGELGVCHDVEEVREVPVLHDSFEGQVLGYDFDRRLWWWFVDCFTEDREQRARLHRMGDEIRRVFLDLAKLHKATTGEATVFPEALVRCLERRVVAAACPAPRELAIAARRQPTARASLHLKRLTTEESWRTES